MTTNNNKLTGITPEQLTSLINKGKRQNNKLTFEDITTFATTMENFAQDDFGKVMEELKALDIDIVEQLSPDDLAQPASEKKAADRADKPQQLVLFEAEDLDNPTNEELQQIDVETMDAGDTDDLDDFLDYDDEKQDDTEHAEDDVKEDTG